MPGKYIRDEGAADKAKQDADTEGHGMLIDPSTSRDLARGRAKDVERESLKRNREKEARGR
jgi:hypothetical protein